jgi:tetratricopeptide (TPR) repeat protein
MGETIEIKRKTAWWSLAIQLPIMALLIFGMYEVAGLRPLSFAAFAGAAIYLLWSRLSKAYALRFHRRGLQQLQDGRYAEAANEFSQSYRWFSNHRWLDRHRFSLLLDSNAWCYRETALINEAAARLAAGSVEDAYSLYQQALQEFPTSDHARTGQVECEKVIASRKAIK